MRLKKGMRDVVAVARAYDLELEGLTARGHLRFRHKPTGRMIVTVASLTNRKVLRNTERDFRHFVGALNG